MTTLKSNLLKKGKKGFTLTELAIVIAVIAILIAVLVPTFTSIITKANLTVAAENAHNALTEYTVETNLVVEDDSIVESDGYYFTVESGSISTDNYTETDNTSGMYAYEWTDTTFTVATIYVTADYVTEHSTLAGFSDAVSAIEQASTTTTTTADEAEAAAKAAMPTSNLNDGDVYYAAVTVPDGTEASYWFKLTYDTDSWTVETSTSNDYTTAVGANSATEADMSNTSYYTYSVSYIAG